MLVTMRNFSDTMDHLDRYLDLTWDLETTGLNPYLGNCVVGIAIGPAEVPQEFYFPLRHANCAHNLPPEYAPRIWRLLATRKCLYSHNGIVFDAQFAGMEDPGCLHSLVLTNDVAQIDTIILALLDDENRESYKLESLCKEFDPSAGEPEQRLLEHLGRIGVRGKQAKAQMFRLDPHMVEPYACADIRNCRNLFQYLIPRVHRQGLASVAEETMRFGRLLSRIRRYGLHIDRAALERQMVRTAKLERKLLADIHAAAGYAINPKSPPQLSRWLGMKSTAKEALKRARHPHAELLMNYRKASKASSTYLEPILKSLDANDVIHPQLNLTRDPRDRGGTRSSRLSCSNPNFQALPVPSKDPLNIYGVRACVTPRDGNVLIGSDYDRFEVYMAGSYSGDPYVFDMYENNTDPYIEMAADLGVSRSDAKIAFLALQYGIGCFELGRKLGISETEAWHVREAWRERHESIYHAMLAESRAAQKTGKLTLWNGRIIHFDEHRTKFYAAWNRRIQGSCAGVIQDAMLELERPLAQLGAEIILQIHDELWVEAPEENAEIAARVIKSIMEGYNEFDLRPRATPTIGMNAAVLKD